MTDDGNFDINDKRLTDVADPVNNNDAATKSNVDNHLGSGPTSDVSKAYVDSENAKQDIAINNKASKSDLDDKLNNDGSNQMNDSLDMNNNKLVNLSAGTDDNNAVNKAQLDSRTSNNQVNYHLQPRFTFFKNFGDNDELNVSNYKPDFQPSDNFFYNHVHKDFHVVEKEGFDNDFGGQLKMNNDKLPAGVYTCVFEIFAYTALLPPKITNETLITQVHGDSHYNVITFSHDRIDNQKTKVFIQFSSDGQLGGITFEMRYYGSRFNRFILFGFYSRVIAGKQNIHFNHDILSVTSEDDNREVLYFENMNMNKNKIKGLGDPVDDTDSANKKYVDSGNAKQDIAIADKTSKSILTLTVKMQNKTLLLQIKLVNLTLTMK